MTRRSFITSIIGVGLSLFRRRPVVRTQVNPDLFDTFAQSRDLYRRINLSLSQPSRPVLLGSYSISVTKFRSRS